MGLTPQGAELDSWRKTRSPGKCPDSPQAPACPERTVGDTARGAWTVKAGAEDSKAGTAPTPRVLQTQWDFSTWRSGSRPHPHPQSRGAWRPPALLSAPRALPLSGSRCRPGPPCRGGQVCTPVTGSSIEEPKSRWPMLSRQALRLLLLPPRSRVSPEGELRPPSPPAPKCDQS